VRRSQLLRRHHLALSEKQSFLVPVLAPYQLLSVSAAVMTISALRPLDARHVSAVATAAAKAPFLRGPGTCSSLGQEDWDYLQDASPSGSEGTPNTGRKQWSPPSHHGFELPEVAMDPMFEDVWEDTVAAVGPLMSSLETQRKAMIHSCNHATKSFQDAIQKNMPHPISRTKSGKDAKSH
jgi:hypothetical protein